MFCCTRACMAEKGADTLRGRVYVIHQDRNWTESEVAEVALLERVHREQQRAHVEPRSEPSRFRVREALDDKEDERRLQEPVPDERTQNKAVAFEEAATREPSERDGAAEEALAPTGAARATGPVESDDEQRLLLEAKGAARRAQWVAEKQAQRESVANYLKENGFKHGVTGPKKCSQHTTYPLHHAAKEGNVRMVEMLLREGARVSQLNSAGQTAAQVVSKINKDGSHARVLNVLGNGGAVARGWTGGC